MLVYERVLCDDCCVLTECVCSSAFHIAIVTLAACRVCRDQADDVAPRHRYSCQWWRTGQKSLHAPHHHTAAHFLSAISQKPSTATTLKEGGGLPDFEEWKFDKELVYNGVAAERWTYKVKVCLQQIYCCTTRGTAILCTLHRGVNIYLSRV